LHLELGLDGGLELGLELRLGGELDRRRLGVAGGVDRQDFPGVVALVILAPVLPQP
jgi:hypothetical protein